MKIKTLLMGVIVSTQVTAQVSVFDCQAVNSTHLTQSELNSQQTLSGNCIKLGENQSILVSGTQNKTIIASTQIHLKQNVRLGSFTTGKTHLKVEASPIDVAVMNYSNLNSVLRYKKLEFGVKIPTPILTRINRFINEEGVHSDELNPFLEWDIDVEIKFTHPATGTIKNIDGYYHREYVENAVTSDWDDIGTDFPFRIRFAPPLNGKWIAQVKIKTGNQEQTSAHFTFNVVESGDPGYVYVHNNKKNLMRGNRMIFPVGHNIPTPEDNCIAWGGCFGQPGLGNNLWNDANPSKAANTLDWDLYHNKVKSYFDQGGRYIRTIQSPWSSLIEFEKKGNYYDRLHYAWETDKLMDMCEQYDALVHFNMLMHTPFTICDVYGMHAFDWERHRQHDGQPLDYDSLDQYPVYCYNDNPAETGGKQPHEALSNPNDLLYHQQRTRYYIARYGYSTKIYNFELLSEPFNVGANTFQIPTVQPYFASGTTEQQQQIHFDAISTYQGTLAWYIKEVMKHTEHLIGVDYVIPNTDITNIDQSMHHGNIDIIGVNFYNYAHNKYLITKNSDNNDFDNSENSVGKRFRDLQSLAQKPIILAEFGDGDNMNKCSQYIGSYIDAMSAGFTGACGFLLWEGKDLDQSFLWPTTIRAQNHMNGNDVINTLSSGNGQWIQGRQHEKLLGFGQHEAEAKELQYYVSFDKSKSVGYVRNRTYNIHTKSTNALCNLNSVFDGINIPVDNLVDIAYDDGPINKRLKVHGLKNNTTYQVDWYSYKDGWYLKSDCQTSEGTKLTLRFPKLLVTGEVDRPVVWFVIREQSCSKSAETDVQLRNSNQIDLIPSEINIYPNPFEDYVTIDSPIDDKILILDINGKILFEHEIASGSSQINTSELHTGFYIIQFLSQQKQFKIVKQ